MKYPLPLFLFTLFIFSCSNQPSPVQIEKWKEEIVTAERNFAAMAAKDGIPNAFLAFAAEDAVLMRNNQVVIGKNAIEERFGDRTPNSNSSTLSWEPDFVDVAASGDLGYTYGQYISSRIDSNGVRTESRGIFHTVWKRQPDGQWKFVWD